MCFTRLQLVRIHTERKRQKKKKIEKQKRYTKNKNKYQIYGKRIFEPERQSERLNTRVNYYKCTEVHAR